MTAMAHQPVRSISHSGFTLVEMIIVIVITGIIAAVVAVFIRAPVQGYVDLVARANLTDEADTAVRRMSRDLRLPLPNSIRVSPDGTLLELLLTRTGGRYLDEEDGVDSTQGNILDFSNPGDTTFTIVGEPPSPCSTPDCGDMVIYNLGQAPADAYCANASQCNRATITGITGRTVTLAANPFAQQMPSLRSPSHRFQIVSTPVTYACTGGTLMRYSGYTIQATQSTVPPANGTAAMLANGITSCLFSYQLANASDALVGIQIGMERPDTNSGAITLFHQVHVDNTP